MSTNMPAPRRPRTALPRVSFIDTSSYQPVEHNPLVTDSMDHVRSAPNRHSTCAAN
jgi:hypothetical protein